ncbi:MAG: HAD family phosphatase [Clostridia bacterium]|jgi:beta-phosphoglucomutase-like phosphatase (HAD superfamily)|nr:HAD family phosphatase [Clostridia bacterium]
MNTVKGLLFDFNGTLFFDSKYHMEAFRRYFRSHGKPVPTDEFMVHNIFGRTNTQIVRENFNINATIKDIEEFSQEKEINYRKLCLEVPGGIQLVEGAEEMFDSLKEAGIPFCIATGSGGDNIEFYFEQFNLSRWFDIGKNIVFDDGTFKSKPAPDIYLIAAEKIGLSASECAVFEDGTSGMISAMSANAGALVAIYDSSLPDPITEDIHPDITVHSLANWKSILAKLGLNI